MNLTPKGDAIPTGTEAYCNGQSRHLRNCPLSPVGAGADALRYYRGMANENEPDEPRCPHCQGATVLVRTFPKIGGFPELRSYRRTLCEEVVTVEREA
jgi:hypothetical protein